MKKALYIGIYSVGSTSKMRADILGSVLGADYDYKVIDTDAPFNSASRVWRSIAWRYKIGPVIWKLNKHVLRQAGKGPYDLVWVDKGVYCRAETMRHIRAITKTMVHFTPDPAFVHNGSRYFNDCIPYFDWLVSTKTFEKGEYLKHIPEEKLIMTTQGFDINIHKPVHSFDEKKYQAVFIGFCEPHREYVLQHLLNNNIPVVVGGSGWGRFREINKSNPLLSFAGENVRNEAYSGMISSSLFGVGLLSHIIPEQHTTRTLEIPACGTALLTEKNPETGSFYKDDEAIFYDGNDDLVKKINYYRQHRDELKRITENGLRKVHTAGFSYNNIIERVLQKVLA